MCEFASLDRCAAYVAARALLVAVQGVVGSWPTQLSDRARRTATAVVALTAEAVSHEHASAGRRRCLRDAISGALGVAAAVDVACAMGFDDADRHDVQRLAGRSVALLAMFLHANTSPIPEGV
jgi:hypothetical protein